MANIGALKINGQQIERVMTGGVFLPTANKQITFGSIVPKSLESWDNQVPSFSEWQINDGWEVEILTPKRLAIKKFKIDTWGVRQIVGWTSPNWKAMYNRMRVKVEGIGYVHQNIICHTPGSDTPDGFTKAYGGSGGYNVYWYPGQYTSGNSLQGLCVQQGFGYNANQNEREDGFILGKHPWDVGTISCIEDGETQGPSSDGSYATITIGLFGGTQNAPAWHDESTGAYRQYDITDHPIIVDLDAVDATKGIDPSSGECWDIYKNGQTVYHKDKTVENCWVKYGMTSKQDATTGEGWKRSIYTLQVPEKYTSYGLNLPAVTDLKEWFPENIDEIQHAKMLRFGCSIKNTEYWDTIKEFFKNNTIYSIFCTKLFANSNLSGELEVNVNSASGYSSMENIISWTTVTKITINATESTNLTSARNVFLGATSLTEIVSNKSFYARDLSGMFEYCRKLQSYPSSLIDWSLRFADENMATPATNLGFTFESSGIQEIPLFDSSSSFDSDSNEIKASYIQQAFNTQNLKYIRPRLNVMLVNNEAGTRYLAFNCQSLETAYIYGLNHGDWILDGKGTGNDNHGNLKSLDDVSIQYMIENLNDLVSTYVEGGDPDYETTAVPSVNHANLYLPAEWSGRIPSNLIQSANQKGWTIYVNREVVTA